MHLVRVEGADHTSVFMRLVSWLAGKMVGDTDLTRPFPNIDPAEAQRAFSSAP